MQFSAALVEGARSGVRSPRLVLAVVGYAALSTVVLAADLLAWPGVLLGNFLFVLATPLFVGGLIALAASALDGDGSLLLFVVAGGRSYAGILLGGVVVVLAVAVGLVGAVLVGGFGGFFVVYAFAVWDAGLAFQVIAVFLTVVVSAGVVLSATGPWLLFQFYAAAIVLEGADVVESLSRSRTLVEDDFGSVVAFSVVSAIVYAAAQLPTVLALSVVAGGPTALAAGSVPAPSATGEVVLVLVSNFATATLVGLLLVPYYAAYYRRLVTGTGDEGADATHAAAGDSLAAVDERQAGANDPAEGPPAEPVAAEQGTA